MWIYGYNEAKQMVEVNLPMETVLAEQIDPWRLDLCDPDPVVCQTNQGELRFRRLHDIAFAYRSGSKVFVCAHDGSQTACLESTECEKFFRDHVRIFNPKRSNESFNAHLGRFIGMDGFAPWHGVDDRQPFAWARPARALKLTGTSLELDRDAAMFNHQFPILTGEMFRTVPVPITLPEKIKWVFETFAEFRPVVVGATLRQLLAGLDHDKVEICADRQTASQFKNAAEKLPGVTNFVGYLENFEFCHGGSFYYVRVLGTKVELERVQEPGHLDNYIALSVDGVLSTSANHVKATRIALFDIGRLKVRAVSISAQDEASTLVGSHIKLQIPKGWSVELPIFNNKAQFRTRINNISTQLNQAALKHNAAAALARTESRSLAA